MVLGVIGLDNACARECEFAMMVVVESDPSLRRFEGRWEIAVGEDIML